MQETEIINNLTTKVNSSIEKLESDLSTFKTGRANPSILDNVKVEAYGTIMTLKQVASINVIDARMMQLVPFDPSTIENIAEAIRNDSSLGLNPSDDGHTIRLVIPSLTEERRKELVKSMNTKIEECFVRIRTARHEAIKDLDGLVKSKQISEDIHSRVLKQIESLVKDQKNVIDGIYAKKEQEILTV